MTHLRNLVAVGATAAIVALGQNVLAQDDLDALLNDLESDVPAPATAEAAPAAEEPAVAEPAVAEEPAPAVEEPAVVAEEPAPAESEDELPPVVEDGDPVAAPAVEEPAPAVEEPAPAEDTDPVVAPAEDADPVVAPAAEEPAAPEDPVAPVATVTVAEEPAAEEPAPAAEEPAPAEKPAAKLAGYSGPDAELIANLTATERLRREAYDSQAKREISLARKYRADEDFEEAARHYNIAAKLLNDRPGTEDYRKECETGVADAYYRLALQEDSLGRRDRAKVWMERAKSKRHPKARRMLESWNAAEDPNANKTDISEISHRRNEESYKAIRAKNLKHLKRSRQLLATRELDRALDECELVLLSDPYNEAAIRLRDTIQKKRHTIIVKERKAARDGMIADVDKAWRPVYAKDVREIDNQKSETIKTRADDSSLSAEQNVITRMKEMRLPQISFKPPATIIDAVDFFRAASKDFDRPDLPLEKRGFNFVLRTRDMLTNSAPVEEEETAGFGASDNAGEGASGPAGVPVIPMITASDITFYDALKLVCESVDYKFKVQPGPIVMVMHKDMSVDEMQTRTYQVIGAFVERMGSASSDLKEMRAAGFGSNSTLGRKSDEGEESQEQDWKSFFELLGVKWPEGSTIMYIKTTGKLRVRNTEENLAEFEKALDEMNGTPKLIEIEARFVEVCQEDLNSLGFEWILNSDLSLNVGKHISRALNLKGGKWGKESGSTSTTTSYTLSNDSLVQNGGIASTVSKENLVDTINNSYTSTRVINGSGSSWSRWYGGNSRKSVGVSSFGGDTDYGTGMRYLSTDSNHISGESNSTNDQFMRLNAFIGNADLSMILHMLSQRSDTDLLSAPKVLTRSSENAVMKVVTEYIYPTDYEVQLQSSSSGSSGNNGGSQSAILAVVEPQSFTMREVGVILDVTPTLMEEGNLIEMHIKADVVDEPTWKNYGMKIPFTGNAGGGNTITFPDLPDIASGRDIPESIIDTVFNAWARAVETLATGLGGGGNNITYYDAPMEQPFFHVRSIDSNVTVHPGATIVMGGLITEQRKAMDDKIPFLGDLPLIGRLFRSHSEQTNKRNLLIFVTTRLVDVRGREVANRDEEEKTAGVLSADNAE